MTSTNRLAPHAQWITRSANHALDDTDQVGQIPPAIAAPPSFRPMDYRKTIRLPDAA